MAALTGKFIGTPDDSYLSLLHFGSNDVISGTLVDVQDGGGNNTGIQLSTSTLKYSGIFNLASLTPSTLVYLNSSKNLVSLAAGTDGYVLTLASGLPSWAASPAPSLTSTRIGFGSGSNLLTGSASLAWDDSGKQLQLTNAAGSVYSRMKTAAGTYQAAITFNNDTSEIWFFGKQSDDNFIVYDSAHSKYKFVINNAVDELYLLQSGGHVGIGTTGPNAGLEIQESSGNALRLGYTGGGYVDITVSTAGVVTFNATGSSHYFTFSDSVDVGGKFFVNASTGDLSTIKNISYSWPSAHAAVNGYVLTSDTSGNLTWDAASGGSSQWTTIDANSIYYKGSSATKVGIGQATPEYRLDISNTSDLVFNDYIRLGGYNNGSSGAGGGIMWKPNYTGYTKISAMIQAIGEDDYFREGLGFYTNSTADSTTDATIKFRIHGDGRIWGTALHNNSSAVTGTSSQYIASGTYTPTLTGVTNVAASTARLCQWIRVGNVVTVAGQCDIDPTAAGQLQLGISLPIASSLTTAYQLGGSAAMKGVAGVSAGIEADATNDRAQLEYVAVDITNKTMAFTFSYEIL